MSGHLWFWYGDKVRIIIFGCIISHSECIFIPFVVFLWHLIWTRVWTRKQWCMTSDLSSRLIQKPWKLYQKWVSQIGFVLWTSWQYVRTLLCACDTCAPVYFWVGQGVICLCGGSLFLAVGSGCSTNPHSVYLYFRYVIQFSSPLKPRGSAATIKSARLLLVTE